MTVTDQFTGRDYQAWGSMFSLIRRQQEELRTLHARLADELGFERVPVVDIKAGDVVRSPRTGGWYEVDHVIYHLPDDDEPFHRITFTGADGYFDVRVLSEETPYSPLVTRRYQVPEDIF